MGVLQDTLSVIEAPCSKLQGASTVRNLTIFRLFASPCSARVCKLKQWHFVPLCFAACSRSTKPSAAQLVIWALANLYPPLAGRSPDKSGRGMRSLLQFKSNIFCLAEIIKSHSVAPKIFWALQFTYDLLQFPLMFLFHPRAQLALFE
jgi:hypothetical protein